MFRREFCSLFLLSGCMITVGTPQNGENAPPLRTTPAPAGGLSAQSLDAVNKIRQKYGLVPLKTNLECENAAQTQSKNMSETGVYEHEIPSLGASGTIPNRMRAANVNLPAGENIHKSSSDLLGVIASWERSPVHLKNIINPDFRRYGIGKAMAKTTPHAGYVPYYWTMVLSV